MPSMIAAHASPQRMRRPWQTHLSIAFAVLAAAFAVSEFWSGLAGAALAAVAFFIAMRPLFRKDAVRTLDEA
jgi:hypothetical protein